MQAYRYYYSDSINDDFSKIQVEQKETKRNYKYYSRNPIFRLFQFLVYYLIALPIISIMEFIILRGTIKNRKVLKKAKGKGYFMYGNHTSMLSDAYSPALACFPRRTSIVCSSGTLHIPLIKPVLKMVGAFPVPSTATNTKNFVKALGKMMRHKQSVMIYPEAHIWPKYNEIRDFSDVSFSYPVKFNVPCFTKTTVYKETRNGRTRPVIYIDGPFYPDMSLSKNEAKNKLRNEIYEAMEMRAADSKPDIRYQYIKKEGKPCVEKYEL